MAFSAFDSVNRLNKSLGIDCRSGIINIFVCEVPCVDAKLQLRHCAEVEHGFAQHFELFNLLVRQTCGIFKVIVLIAAYDVVGVTLYREAPDIIAYGIVADKINVKAGRHLGKILLVGDLVILISVYGLNSAFFGIREVEFLSVTVDFHYSRLEFGDIRGKAYIDIGRNVSVEGDRGALDFRSVQPVGVELYLALVVGGRHNGFDRNSVRESDIFVAVVLYEHQSAFAVLPGEVAHKHLTVLDSGYVIVSKLA